jgi:enamine deaminase RidA (YjgF/YER057c/UK114 family)
VAVDKDKRLIGEGDLGAQAMQAFHNLQTAISAAGAKVADVVKLNVYVKDYKLTDAPLINEALRKHFPQKNLPASTWLGVQVLAEEKFLIEVDAIVVVGGLMGGSISNESRCAISVQNISLDQVAYALLN